MATSNPGTATQTPPTGTAAASYTWPFLNVTGNINADQLILRQPWQIQQGSHLLSGVGVPNVASGVNGDLYIRKDGSTSTHLYFKHAGTWGAIA